MQFSIKTFAEWQFPSKCPRHIYWEATQRVKSAFSLLFVKMPYSKFTLPVFLKFMVTFKLSSLWCHQRELMTLRGHFVVVIFHHLEGPGESKMKTPKMMMKVPHCFADCLHRGLRAAAGERKLPGNDHSWLLSRKEGSGKCQRREYQPKG